VLKDIHVPLGVLTAGACAVMLGLVVASCVAGKPAADTGDPGFPFGPTSVVAQPLGYNEDIQPIFASDCFSCHNSRDARGGYSVATYADAVAGQHPGNAKSSVVVDCAPGGSMYGYFSGNRVDRATKVFRWLVYYGAAQTR
jgi:hypothetical protein